MFTISLGWHPEVNGLSPTCNPSPTQKSRGRLPTRNRRRTWRATEIQDVILGPARWRTNVTDHCPEWSRHHPVSTCDVSTIGKDQCVQLRPMKHWDDLLGHVDFPVVPAFKHSFKAAAYGKQKVNCKSRPRFDWKDPKNESNIVNTPSQDDPLPIFGVVGFQWFSQRPMWIILQLVPIIPNLISPVCYNHKQSRRCY